MADEIIGGVAIGVTADFSDLDAAFDAAVAKAVAEGQSIADAIAAAMSTRPDISGLTAAADTVDAAWQKLGQDMAAALGITLPTPDVSGVTAALGEVDAAAKQASGELGGLGSSAAGAAPGFQAMGNEAGAAGTAAKTAGEDAASTSSKFEEMAEKLAAIGEALAFTEKLVEFGKAAIEASDAVQRASIALGALTGDSAKAEESIAALEQVARDEGLSMPQLGQAAIKMTALLGPSADVVTNLKAIGEVAKVMGTDIETAAAKFDLIVESGKASAKSLAGLGLSMDDIKKSMADLGIATSLTLADLDKFQRNDVLLNSMAKFHDAAMEMSQTIGEQWKKLGADWEAVMKQIGDALQPVIAAILKFADQTVIPAIESIVNAFRSLPGPVQDTAIALGLAAAAIVPIAAGLAGIAVAVGGLSTLFETVGAAAATFGGILGVTDGAVAALAAALPEVVIPLGAIAAAIALIDFTSLQEQLTAFVGAIRDQLPDVSGIVDNLKTAFTDLVIDVTAKFENFGSTFVDLAHQIQTFGADVAQTIGPLVYEFSPLKAAIDALSDALGHVSAAGFVSAMELAVGSIAPVIGALDGLSTYLKGLSENLKNAKAAWDLFTGDVQNTSGALAAANTALGDLNTANANFARQISDILTATKGATEAVQPYAKAIQDLYDAQGKANDKLAEAKAVLQAVRQDYQDGQASVEDLTRAQAEYEKAVKSASVSTDAMKDSLKAAKDAAKEFAAEVKNANDIVVTISSLIDKLPSNIHDYFSQLASGGQTAKQLLSEVTAEIDKAVQASTKLSGAPLAAVQEWIAKLRDAQSSIKALAEDAAWDEFAGKITSLAAKFPQQVGEMTGSLRDLVTQALLTAQQVPEAMAKIDPAALIGKWLEIQKQLDDQTRTMGDHFTEAMNKYRNAVQNETIPVTLSLLDRLNEVDRTMQGLAVDGSKLWNTTAIGQYYKALQDINAAGYTTQQQQEAQVKHLQDIYDKLVSLNAPLGEQLAAYGNILQEQIKIGEEEGKDTNDYVLALEKVKLKLDENKLASHGFADEMVKGINDILKGFDQLGQAMGDAIVNGNNLGEALVGVFKKIAASILGDLINAALLPLKQALIEMIASIIPGFGSATGSILTGINAIGPASAAASTGLTSLGTAAAAAATAISSATAAVTASNAAEASSAASVTAAQVGEAAAMAAEVGADTAAAAATAVDTAATTADTAAKVADTTATAGEAAAMAAEAGVTAADAAATTADTAAKTANAAASATDAAATVADAAAKTADTATTAADAAAKAAETAAEIADTAATIADTVAHIALAAAVSAVAAVIGAIAGIVGDVYLAAISTKLFHIETSLLEIRNETENRRADAWSQFGSMYDRLGEILNDANSMRDSLLTLASGGVGGGVGTNATADLDTIAASSTQIADNTRNINFSIQALNQTTSPKLQILDGDLQVINSTLFMINGSILSLHGVISNSSQSLVEQMNSLQMSGSATGRAITSAIDGASGDANSAAQQVIANTSAAVYAAHDVAGQITALQAEYRAYETLIANALQAGDVALATQYQQAAQAVMRQIGSLEEGQNVQSGLIGNLSDAIYQTSSGTTTAVGSASDAITRTVTYGSNGIVNAVVSSAAMISAAVSSAVTAAGAAAGASVNRTVTQPGVMGTGGATPYTGVPNGPVESPGWTPPPGTTSTGSQVPQPPVYPPGSGKINFGPPNTADPSGIISGVVRPSTAPETGTTPANTPFQPLPMFATGGYAAETGVGIVEKGEYVLSPDQVDRVLDFLNPPTSVAPAQAAPVDRPDVLTYGRPGAYTAPGPALSDLGGAIKTAAQQQADAQAAATQQLKDQLMLLQYELSAAISNAGANSPQAQELQLQIAALLKQINGADKQIADSTSAAASAASTAVSVAQAIAAVASQGRTAAAVTAGASAGTPISAGAITSIAAHPLGATVPAGLMPDTLPQSFTPSYGGFTGYNPYTTPTYYGTGTGAGSGASVNITAPITVNGVQDGAQLAKTLVLHLKRTVAQGGLTS